MNTKVCFQVIRQSARKILAISASSIVLATFVLAITNENIQAFGLDEKPLHNKKLQSLSSPTGIDYNSINHRIYVVNSGSNSVTEILSSNGKVMRNIPLSNVSNPTSIAVDAEDQELFVVSTSTDKILVIDIVSGKTVGNISLFAFDNRFDHAYQYHPYAIVLGRNGILYALAFREEVEGTCTDDTIISVIDGKLQNVTQSISIASCLYPSATITFDSKYNLVYTASVARYLKEPLITIIDATRNQIVKQLLDTDDHPAGDARTVTVNPINGDAFFGVGGYSCNVRILNGTSHGVISRIPINCTPSASVFDSKNNSAYIGTTNGKVMVIDGKSYELKQSISIGSRVYGLAFDSHKNLIYATDPNSNTISVIDGKTNQVIRTIT